ncbi:unnamed protein product [Euphydryas editha]|uniref:Uncharacterized protein n=1 Tax=Euphydryas editha TaxID=104508 RepID=A0AAU9UY34_EUPED|nr:unnamed protein product [Euphydryas editha]
MSQKVPIAHFLFSASVGRALAGTSEERKCAIFPRPHRAKLTIDKNVLPPNVVLAPAVVVLDVAVLELRQRGQGGRRSRRQELRGRRRRAERLNGLRVLILHEAGAPSLITHREARGWRWPVRGRACAAASSARVDSHRTAGSRAPLPPPHPMPPPYRARPPC